MSDKKSDRKIKLTRRRALGGLGTIGVAGALAGAGTTAYFSDEQDSENNQISAGTIDLQTNGNENAGTSISVDNVAPGDSGTESFNLNNVGSLRGFLSLEFGEPEPRNDLTEVLEVTVKVAGTVIRKGTFGSVFDGEGEWSNADVPFGPGAAKTFAVEWEVPSGAGNDTQGEQAKGDITFYLNQEEEAFADLVVDPGSGGNVSTIQEGVDDIPSDGVLLVRDGTYNEAVTVDTSGVKIASKNGTGATELVPDPVADNNKALLIDGVDDVTVDGLRVSLTPTEASNNEKFAIRAIPDGSSSGSGPDNLTVRDCQVDSITAGGSSPSGSVVATGIGVDLNPTGSNGGDDVTASNFVVENSTVESLTCTASPSSGDSRAKGIAVNGDVNRVKIVRNDIKDIGQDPETDKPRGITLTEDGDSEGPTNFTILDNTIQDVAGSVGQPALFVGGSNGLGDNEVYNNVFYQPVDNLSAAALRLRQNTWENDADDDGVPELLQPGTDGDGGNLIDRGSSAYDTTYAI